MIVFLLAMLEVVFCAVIQVAFLKEVGQKLSEVSPRGLNGALFLFLVLCLFLLLPCPHDLQLDKAPYAVVSKGVTIGKYTSNRSMDMRFRIASIRRLLKTFLEPEMCQDLGRGGWRFDHFTIYCC